MVHDLERPPQGLFPQDMTAAVGEVLKGRQFEMIPAPVREPHCTHNRRESGRERGERKRERGREASAVFLRTLFGCALFRGVFLSHRLLLLFLKPQSLRMGKLRITVGMGDPTAPPPVKPHPSMLTR